LLISDRRSEPIINDTEILHQGVTKHHTGPKYRYFLLEKDRINFLQYQNRYTWSWCKAWPNYDLTWTIILLWFRD